MIGEEPALPRRARRRVGATAVVALSLAAGLGWGGATILSPTSPVPSAAPFSTVDVRVGVVTSAIELNVESQWASTKVGVNRRSGIVTSVDFASGDVVTQGSKIYTVDLQPVFVAQGDVPSFRAIQNGIKGADVQQVQQLLQDLGFYHGDVDGAAGTATARAIASWQSSNDLEPTGVLSSGDIVFVPKLPARLALDQELILRGAELSGGEAAPLAFGDEPVFTLSVSLAQADLIVEGTAVEISAPDGSVWAAVADEVTPGEHGASVRLRASAGSSICSAACGLLDAEVTSLLSAKVVILAPIEGLIVPLAALRTRSDGATTVVIDKAGEEHPVEVVATARGLSVITGIQEGTSVRLPALEK